MTKLTEKQQNVMMRIFVLLFACLLALMAIAAIKSGRYTYRNYSRGPVFAPFALAGAILFLIAGLKLTRARGKPPKLTRKQRRLEEEARRTRFPIDDFDKPWKGQ